jgi:hypothetical protein
MFGIRNIKIGITIHLTRFQARFFSRGKRRNGNGQVFSNPKILPAHYPMFKSQGYQRQGLHKFKEILMRRVCREILTRVVI